MLLRENKTLETALRFVALSIGLCALPAFVSRLIDNLAIVARVVHGQPVEGRLAWFQASGLTYSAVLCGASCVLFFRPHWFVSMLGVSNEHGAIRIGSQRFWMSCVRAAGVAAAMFGAAWLAHAVLRYRGVLPLPAKTDLYVIRGEFVGAMMSLAVGAVWAVSPSSLRGAFADAGRVFKKGTGTLTGDLDQSAQAELTRASPLFQNAGGSGMPLSDRHLLEESIRAACLLTLAFRFVLTIRFAALLLEEATPWASVRGFAGEFAGLLAAGLVLKNRTAAARSLQSVDYCCQSCGVEQSIAGACPECGDALVQNESEGGAPDVDARVWLRGCVRLVAMGLFGWCAATAVARGSLLLLLLEGDHPDLRVVVWGIIMGAGAPAIAVLAMVLLIVPNMFRWVVGVGVRYERNPTASCAGSVQPLPPGEVKAEDNLARTGRGVIALVMLAQTVYLIFLPAGYYARTVAGIPGSQFYPSGLVASVQCLAAMLVTCWFFWRSRG